MDEQTPSRAADATTQALSTVERLWISLLGQLPQILIGLFVFIVFLFVARGVRAVIRNVNARLGRQHNVGMVLGRLAQGAIVLVGLLVALVIAVPGFQPG
jgi:small-conductance mechanosensitive channel